MQNSKLHQQLVKLAMIRLNGFKHLKNIKIPWYRKFLIKRRAINNADIQSALRQAMPGPSGKISRILQDLTDRARML